MLKEGIKFNYNAIIKRIDRNTGKVLDTEKIHNLLVNDGLNLVRNWLAGDAINNPSVIAIGEGTTTPANADTSLESEVTRATATITKPENYQVQYYKLFTFGSGESYTITEAGLFDSVTVSGSTMLNRLTFSAKNVDADTNLSITITITAGRG